MKQTIKVISSVFVALFISTFGIIGHASAAMPAGAHGTMEHKTTSSVNCATICLSAPADKNRESPVYNEEDDEPAPPSYLQFTSAQTGWYAEKQITARSIDEPGKIPKYRLCCVIRL